MKNVLRKLQTYFIINFTQPLPMLRIIIWIGLFLWLGPFIVSSENLSPIKYGEEENLAGMKGVRSMVTPFGFRKDVTPKVPSVPRLAWVGGSEGLMYTGDKEGHDMNRWNSEKKTSITKNIPGYLPVLLSERISARGGKKPEVLMYLLGGGKLYDTYVALLHALKQDPDVVIISLNSVWLYTNKSITSKSWLPKEAVYLLPFDMQNWKILAQLTTPLQIIEGLGSPIFKVLSMRPEFFGKIKSYMPSAKLNIMQHFSQKEEIAPANFWIMNENNFFKHSSAEIQELIIRKYSKPEDDGSINKEILFSMFNVIKRSNAKFFLYTAPVNPQLFDDPEIAAKLASIRQNLETLSIKKTENNAEVWIVNPGHPLAAVDFNDNMHINNPERFINILTDKLLERYNSFFQ